MFVGVNIHFPVLEKDTNGCHKNKGQRTVNVFLLFVSGLVIYIVRYITTVGIFSHISLLY